MTNNSNVNNNKLIPCVRNCCLDENDVCVGCYRSLSEIIGWRDKSENQIRVILTLCEQRRINSRSVNRVL